MTQKKKKKKTMKKKSPAKQILAWHFVKEDLVPASCTKGIKAFVGQVRKHKGPLALCESGLHASIKPLDALHYATSTTVCRVVCSGRVHRGTDKLVCSNRKVLAIVDTTEMLQEFSRWCALQVIHLWDAPPVVKEYLLTGDKSRRAAAEDAAWAAWAAAGDAAAWAAGDAARDAARAARAAAQDVAYAAGNAAGAAGWAAVGAAAWAAAGVAAYAAQDAFITKCNKQLEKRLLKLIKKGGSRAV